MTAAINDQRNLAMADAYRAGATLTDLAARYHLTRCRVRALLHEQGAIAIPDIARDPLFLGRAIEIAAAESQIDAAELLSPGKGPRSAVRARWAVMAAMRRRGTSTPSIGRRLGRDHTTVIYGLRQAAICAERDPAFAAMLAKVDAA